MARGFPRSCPRTSRRAARVAAHYLASKQTPPTMKTAFASDLRLRRETKLEGKPRD